ncbi:efflux RND transporter permease subunit [Gluconacetobacter sacchari]|uniref:efflux RND transporter permease subunit n=1 Tax=Gluconacetobacter sacchari TaxID=92759 RepID=UPI0039B478D8
MRFTDLFIHRPVLAVVVCAVLTMAGVRMGFDLPIQQFPQITSDVITISTAYYGADAETIAGFITTPIEAAVSAAEGVDYISSSSQNSLSTITVNLRLNQPAQKVVGEVMAYVSSVSNRFPPGTQVSAISVSTNNPASMYIAVASPVLRPEQVTDYINRVVLPQLRAVPGVIRAQNQADFTPALRIWFDPEKLAGYGLTASEAATVLAQNDYVTGIGTTTGGMTYANLAIASGLHTQRQFRDLILARRGTALIRLGDVAHVEYGSERTNLRVSNSLGQGGFLEIQLSPTANMLQTTEQLREVVAHIRKGLPPGLSISVLYDLSDFVHASLHEVMITLVQAVAIVSVVIFFFLGSWRSVLIPLATIPASLVGTIALMGTMGFSINTLTLLALVLSIGLVVDDAIIVVENVNRRLALGQAPLDASLLAGRELAGPIVAMTLVLIAAYIPIGMQKGLTGALFSEFAFTLAASVTVSAVLALTLSPMMSSQLLLPHDGKKSRLTRLSDMMMFSMQRIYESLLRNSLHVWPAVIAGAFLFIGISLWMLRHAPHELAPQEDQGLIMFAGQAPPSATMDLVSRYNPPVLKAFDIVNEAEDHWLVDTTGALGGGLALKPWSRRNRSAAEISDAIQAQLNAVTGVQLAAFQLPPLPGSSGMPVQFVLKSSGAIHALADAARILLTDARKSGRFAYIDNDLRFDELQIKIQLDRDKIAALGLHVNDIGDTLNWLLGGGYINYFSRDQRSYRVMTMSTRQSRLNAEQILNYPIAFTHPTNKAPVPIPLSSVATLSEQTVPESIAHFQGLGATTFSAIPAPGVSVDQAYATLVDLVRRRLPGDFATDATGSLRDYLRESGYFVPSFAFGMAIIFLALSTLFQSFRDSLIILVSVPMSVAGASLFLWLGMGGASLNIYSEIGLVSLAGLISKHGILIVEVANEMQQQGQGKREAVVHAALTRLRPILMTSTAMVLGVLPLLAAHGAGANSRYVMGLVLATGLLVGTIFTLFVVPAFYLLLARRHGVPSPGKDISVRP